MAKRKRKEEEVPEDQGPLELAIVGELFEEEENDIIKSLLDVRPEEEVTIYFDCSGGSVYSAISISTLIRLRKLKATAIVLGECSSAAILIFATCQKRFVTPRSVFLFHRVKWRSEKDVRSDEASNWASHFHWLEREVDQYQADLFGIASETFDRWIQEGRFVLGSEMVNLGVAEMLDV